MEDGVLVIRHPVPVSKEGMLMIDLGKDGRRVPSVVDSPDAWAAEYAFGKVVARLGEGTFNPSFIAQVAFGDGSVASCTYDWDAYILAYRNVQVRHFGADELEGLSGG